MGVIKNTLVTNTLGDSVTTLLRSTGLGWIVPSLITGNAATYSQTLTTITVTSTAHNIPATVHNGKNVYLAMGTAATGATIPAGWFTNFTYVDANTFTCTSTVSQTGTGAVNTNIAQTTVTDLSISVPGGMIGANGSLRMYGIFSYNNNANSKTLRSIYGGTIWSSMQVSATVSAFFDKVFYNRGVENKQVSPTAGAYGVGSNSGAVNYTAIDSSAAQTMTHTLQCAVASDYIALELMVIEVKK